MPENEVSKPARVPYVFPAPGTSEVADIIRERRGNKPLIDLDGVLLNAEPIAAGWNELGRGIRNLSSIGDDLREILTLRVAVLNGSAYVWREHENLSRSIGISGEVLRRVRTAPAFLSSTTGHDGILSPLYTAALLYTDHATRNIRVPDDVFARLRALLADDRQMVEVVATVAGYNLTTRVLVPLNVAGLADCEVPIPDV